MHAYNLVPCYDMASKNALYTMVSCFLYQTAGVGTRLIVRRCPRPDLFMFKTISSSEVGSFGSEISCHEWHDDI
jgi:hypothetical protein